MRLGGDAAIPADRTGRKGSMLLKNYLRFSAAPLQDERDWGLLPWRSSLALAFVSLSDRLGLNGRRQPDEPPEILRDAGHEELVARSAETAKPHSFKTERGLQMCK